MTDLKQFDLASARRRAVAPVCKSVIQPIVVPKAADVLGDRLRGLIVSGHFAPGDPLPAERELAIDAGLSRASVRSALRVLETEGLVVTKVGRAGGSMVTLPGRNSVVRSVELFVRTHGVALESLLECRVAVEPTLARLAASKRTDEQLEEIAEIHRKFVASIDNAPVCICLNRELHLAIARASGNEPLIAVMESILSLIRDAQNNHNAVESELRVAAKDHTAILQAIADKNGDAAFERMGRDVSTFRDVVAKAAATRNFSGA